MLHVVRLRSHTLRSLKATQEATALADAYTRVKDSVVYNSWPCHHWVIATRHRNTKKADQCYTRMGFPGSSDDKESACNWSPIPRTRRSPGKENCYLLQYSYLENPTDRREWQATVHGVAELDTFEGLTLDFWKGYISVGHGKRVLHLPIDRFFSIDFYFTEFLKKKKNQMTLLHLEVSLASINKKC